MSRQISRIVQAQKKGPLSRLIGTVDIDGSGIDHILSDVDPFILLDHAAIDKNAVPPFGKHPHRGHSVVTVIMKGREKSWDSFSNKETILEGPASYLVDAGTGVFHDEVSVIKDESNKDEHVSLFQLWIGVKEEDRHSKPRVQAQEDIPSHDIEQDDQVVGSIRYYLGGDSTIETIHETIVTHVTQKRNTVYRLPINPKYGGFIIKLNGSDWLPKTQHASPASFGGSSPKQYNDVLVLDEASNGEGYLEITTSENDDADYLVCVGEKTDEEWYKKLAANGAVIASTKDEARSIAERVQEYSITGKETGNFAPFGVAP